MVASEIVADLVRINLALAAGVAMVAALRLPARRLIGARLGYALWLIPLLAAIAVMLPARTVEITVSNPAVTIAELLVHDASMRQALPPVSALILTGWLTGAAGVAGMIGWRQAQFLRRARQGLAGPAAVGFIRPRVVLPADFDDRYSRAERDAVLAHEQAHLAAQHPRMNGLAAALQSLFWFNPLVHLGAWLCRLDQELACDAIVVARSPGIQRLYAETLLKTQLATAPLPLGCYWPPKSEHPLTRRVEMLARPAPGRARRIAGTAAVTATALLAAAGAWAAQPPQTVSRPSSPLTARPSPTLLAALAQSTAARPAPTAGAKAGRGASLELTDPQNVDAIVADSMLILRDGRETIFAGHVRLTQGGRTTYADKLTVRLSEAVFQRSRANAGVQPQRAAATPSPDRAAPAPDRLAQASVAAMPEWISLPKAEDLVRFYPAEALRAAASGMARLDCTVTADGRLADCNVTSESPTDLGFGEAALQLVPLFQMAPIGRNGQAVAGAHVVIPIKFALN